MEFVLNQPVGFEESLTCEFKEVKAQPVQTIGKIISWGLGLEGRFAARHLCCGGAGREAQSVGAILHRWRGAYRRTIGGTKKLSGAELFIALAAPLQDKIPKPDAPSLLARLPTVHRRAQLVEPFVRGRRVLWVDDHPSNTFYERVALAEMGLMSTSGLSHRRLATALDLIRRHEHEIRAAWKKHFGG